MRPLQLLNLLVRNAKRGEFRAEGNTIWLYDVIVGSDEEAEWFGGVSASAFINQLKALSGPVTLRINSPGGEVFAAVAMAQAMREYSGEITVMVDGLAASAATFLAISGARTVMAPGAFMMIHKASTVAWGNSDELLQTAEVLDKVDGSIAAGYAAKGAKEAAEFLDLMAKETWLTGEEAIALGLADEVSSASQKIANRWDLSAYAGAPRIEPTREPDSQAAAAAQAQQDAERRRRQATARLLTPA